VRKGELSANQLAVVFLLPPFLIYAIFVFYPIGNIFYLSFHSWDLMSPIKFIGWKNYENALLKDPLVWKAIKNSIYFLLISLASQVPSALLLALGLHKLLRWKSIYQTIILIPWMLSLVAVGLIWCWIFSPLYGLLNQLLTKIGLEEFTRSWLTDAGTALPLVTLTGSWKATGYWAIFFLAALLRIPESLWDAAKIDGCSSLQQFFHVTLPLLKSVTTVVFTLIIIGALRTFDLIYTMTAGGPYNRTLVMSVYLYYQGFRFMQFGYGSTMAVLLFVIVFVISISYLKFARKAKFEY